MIGLRVPKFAHHVNPFIGRKANLQLLGEVLPIGSAISGNIEGVAFVKVNTFGRNARGTQEFDLFGFSIQQGRGALQGVEVVLVQSGFGYRRSSSSDFIRTPPMPSSKASHGWPRRDN